MGKTMLCGSVLRFLRVEARGSEPYRVQVSCSDFNKTNSHLADLSLSCKIQRSTGYLPVPLRKTVSRTD